MSNALELIATAESMQPAAPLHAGELPPDLATYEDAQDPDVKGPWQIETTGSADWALSRLAECEAEADEIDRQVAAAVEKLKARGEDLKARAARGASFFRYKLLVYAETHRASLLTGKKKSRDFLHGRIGWRKKGGRLAVEDKAALEAWLLAQPIERGLYRMKVEPEMKALQALCSETGEVPPGCGFVPEYEDIVIEASGPEAALAKGGQ
jgi:phage host-nuclease inhibitor protein Gam